MIFNFYDKKDEEYKEVEVTHLEKYLHVYPSSNGWGIYYDYKLDLFSICLGNDRLIMEVEDKELAEKICEAFNNFISNLYSTFHKQEVLDSDNAVYTIQQEAYDDGHFEGYEDGYNDGRESVLLPTKKQIRELLESLDKGFCV